MGSPLGQQPLAPPAGKIGETLATIGQQEIFGHSGNVGRAKVRAAGRSECHVGHGWYPGRFDHLTLLFPGLVQESALRVLERGFWILVILFPVSLLTGRVGRLTGDVRGSA
jgi:hypothetical protein